MQVPHLVEESDKLLSVSGRSGFLTVVKEACPHKSVSGLLI